MLRVLTLSTLYPDATRPNFGRFVERQTQGLAAEPGVDVRVVAPIGVPPWPLSRVGDRERAGLPARETGHGLEVWRPRFLSLPAIGGRFHAKMLTRALAPLLAQIRRDFAFDVIDAEFFFPDGPAAVALGKRFGVPVSIKARGSDVHLWGKRPGTRGQVVGAGQAADGLLAVSAALKRDMVALGMHGERIAVHHTGVDLDRFSPGDRVAAKAALGVSGPLVATVAALIDLKGHDLVIRAVAALPGATLMIAGEGPARRRLEPLIAELGVGDRVKLIGAVPHDRIARLLAAADVMALASEREGLANAWIEALASGTPVVIPDVGGAREVVTAPAHGRIVERSPEAFAAAIGALLAAPPEPLAVRAGVLGFPWQANAAALAAHLRGLVDQARG